MARTWPRPADQGMNERSSGRRLRRRSDEPCAAVINFHPGRGALRFYTVLQTAARVQATFISGCSTVSVCARIVIYLFDEIGGFPPDYSRRLESNIITRIVIRDKTGQW
jgi:hypothetical protein